MTFCINYPEDKFNVILYAASVSIVVKPLAALPVSPRSRSGYRQAAKPVMVLIILSTINQPFSESCGFRAHSKYLQLRKGSSAAFLDSVFVFACLTNQFFKWVRQ